MSFGDPIVGGQTLIRPAIQSPNYKSGLLGWAVKEDGSAEFNNLSTNGVAKGPSAAYDVIAANKQLLVAGTDINDMIDGRARGSLGGMYYNTGNVTRSTVLGSERLLIQTSFPYYSNRQIYMFLSAIRASLGTAVNNMWWIVRWCLQSQGNVTLNSPGSVWVAEHRYMDTGWNGLPPIFKEITGLFDGQGLTDGEMINIALSVNGSGNATAYFFPGDDWWFNIFDMGPRAVANGVDLYTTNAPSTIYRTFQVAAYDSQSFQGGGAASNGSGADNGDRMYYGQDPGYAPNGNWRSYAWFDTNSTAGGNGLGSLSNMVGVAGGNINYLDLYVETDWWYDTSGGGYLHIGHTNAGVNHSSEPGGTYQELGGTWGGRGVGQWISLLGTGVGNAILNGTFQGIILGPGNNQSEYGYAAGADHGSPIIRGGYNK